MTGPEPKESAWSHFPALPAPRAAHSATPFDDGTVLIVGGFDASGMAVFSAYLYDPVPRHWSDAASMTFARAQHSATLFGPNLSELLVAGGCETDGANPTAIKTTEVYSATSAGFRRVGDMIHARRHHASVMLNSSTVFVVGGQDTEANLPSAETFTNADGWREVAGCDAMCPMCACDFPLLPTATLLDDGRVLVVGKPAGSHAPAAVIYDPVNNELSNVTMLPGSIRVYHTATRLHDGKVIIAGGVSDEKGANSLPPGMPLVSSIMFNLYDIPPGSFRTSKDLPEAHAFHTATARGDGVLLVGGVAGVDLKGPTLGTVGKFLFDGEQWIAAGSLRQPRSDHAAWLANTGEVVVAGGRQGSEVLSSAESYTTGFYGQPCVVDGDCGGSMCSTSNFKCADKTDQGARESVRDALPGFYGCSVGLSDGTSKPGWFGGGLVLAVLWVVHRRVSCRPTRTALVLLSALAMFAPLLGCPPDVQGTSGSSSSGAGPLLCSQPGAFICNGPELLECVGGIFVHKRTCDTNEVCNANNLGCDCVPGSVRCLNFSTQEVCVSGPGGDNVFVVSPCKITEFCMGGECTPEGSDKCTLGTYNCDLDNDTVVDCEAVAPDQHLDWVKKKKCSDEGFENGCSVPSPGTQISMPTDMCLNACNVRGVKLMGTLCGPVSQMTCAVLICSNDGTALVPDHTSCLGPGLSCVADTACASCVCKGGLCFGPVVQHCPGAKEICP